MRRVATPPHGWPVTERPTPRPLSLASLLALHLAPGALAVALFVLLADPVQQAGFPPLLAFLIAVAVVIVPIELGTIVLAGRREPDPTGWLPAVRYRRPMPTRDWLLVVPAVLVISIVAFGALSFLEPPIRDGLFGWLPSWFRELVDVDAVSDYSGGAWMVTLASYVALNVFIGPVVEELYFRGYLLPRISSMGRWAPLVNTVLFCSTTSGPRGPSSPGSGALRPSPTRCGGSGTCISASRSTSCSTPSAR